MMRKKLEEETDEINSGSHSSVGNLNGPVVFTTVDGIGVPNSIYAT
jgi:hypothetical protein